MTHQDWILLLGHLITLAGVIVTILIHGHSVKKDQSARHEENIERMVTLNAKLESLEHLHECMDKTQLEMRMVREGFTTLNQRFSDHLELYRIRHEDLRAQIRRERERIDNLERNRD